MSLLVQVSRSTRSLIHSSSVCFLSHGQSFPAGFFGFSSEEARQKQRAMLWRDDVAE
jgi:hypothetical protein